MFKHSGVTQVAALLLAFLVTLTSAHSKYQRLGTVSYDQEDQVGDLSDNLDNSGERVDKLLDSVGDSSIWSPSSDSQQQSGTQADEQTELNNANLLRVLGLKWAPSSNFEGVNNEFRNPAFLTNPRLFYNLIDEFKQQQHHWNPMRENRAFKPRLMSTARGFGKRDVSSATHGRVFEDANRNRATSSKLSNKDVFNSHSKYPDWISETTPSLWPSSLQKYITTKFTDYNG